MLSRLVLVMSHLRRADPIQVAMWVHGWLFASAFIGFSIYALYRFFVFLLTN
jgi:hypothetical protein